MIRRITLINFISNETGSKVATFVAFASDAYYLVKIQE